MNKHKRDTISLFTVVSVAWFALSYALMSSLPQQTRDLISVLITSALPFIFIGSFKLGSLQALTHIAGIDKGLALKQSSSLRTQTYNVHKPEPVVDLEQLKRPTQIEIVDATNPRGQVIEH